MKFTWPRMLWLFVVLVIAASLVRGIASYDDTNTYLSAMQQIEGKTPLWPESSYIMAVIPLLNNVGSVLAAVALKPLTGSELHGLITFNFIAYALATFIFFNLAAIVFSRPRDRWTATILFAANYAILKYGPGAYMVDMGGWLFLTLSLYYATRFFYSQEDRWAYAAGLSSMFGLFFKESGGVGIATLGLLILMSPRTWRDRIWLAVKACSPLLVNIGYHVTLYFTNGYLYFHRYGTVVKDFAHRQTFLRTVKVFGSLFLLGWIPVPFGLWRMWRERLTADGRRFIMLCIAFTAPILIQFAYPAYDQRILFMGVPLFALLATAGLSKLHSTNLLTLFIAAYAVTGFFGDAVMQWFSLDSVLRFLHL
ncbi:MAG TPA: hypothetical protein VMJ72_00495 [Candidatus Paceibacterota bacterium]|nr:hypothetical protein [Candidatus Paceibacterota bacterium]